MNLILIFVSPSNAGRAEAEAEEEAADARWQPGGMRKLGLR